MFEDNKISKGDFIIGSVDKQTDRMSFSSKPKVHSYDSAIAEAKRLAKIETSKKFIVVEVRNVVYTATVVVE